MSEPHADEVRQMLVHPTVWPDLVAWLTARRIALKPMQFSADDLPTYIMTPMDWSPPEEGV